MKTRHEARAEASTIRISPPLTVTSASRVADVMGDALAEIETGERA